MIRHRSTVLIAACVTCLGCTLGVSRNFGLQSAIASAGVNSSALRVAQAPPAVTEQPVLRVGSKGPAVVSLQTKLKQLGFYDGSADGNYTDSTKLAVSKFQKSVGLEADGIAGSTTWSRLQTAEAAKPPSKAAVTPAKPPKQQKNWLRIGLLLALTIAIAGGGIFFLVKWFGKSKKAVKPKFEPDEDDLSTQHSPENGVASQTETLEYNPHANGHNPSILTASLPSHSETHSKLEMPADGLPIEKTTRLSKINIVDELIKDLQAPDPQKRRKAIWELAQQGDSRAVQPLVDLMIDSDSKQRSLILEALSQIGAKTFKPLNRALAVSLQDDNAEVRKNAIRDLTRIYELVAQVTQMLCHAADDPDPEVQETARWAMSQLSRIRTPMALENLPPSQSSRNLLENHDQEPPR
jgi:hypothetical protein